MTMLSTGFGAIVEPRGAQRTRRSGSRGALELAHRRRFAEGGGTTDVDTQGAAAEAAAADHAAAIEAMGGRGDFGDTVAAAISSALNNIGTKFDAQHLGGTILSGFTPGPLGIAGVAVNGLGRVNEAQIQNALEKGNFDAKGNMIGSGLFGETVAINNGPGPTGGGFRDDGSLSNDRSGDGPTLDPINGTASTAPGSQGGARKSTVWNPTTRTYDVVMIQPDGRRLREDGTPLFADGGDTSGLIYGADGGRSDTVEAELPPGGYVIPATEVSARGEGNTLAGALEMARDLGFDLKRLPTVNGGDIPARIAHGEVWVAPKDVRRNGGAGALDRYVMQLRQQHINKLSKLPRPA